MRPHRSLVLALAGAWVLASAGISSAQCLISGPTTFCPQRGAQLCASPGDAYQWTGPNGFASDSQCVTVTLPGDYSLSVFNAEFGFWAGPCTQTLVASPPESCGVIAPPPPPPPPSDTTIVPCPRDASWWARQCRGDADHRVMNAAVLAAVAACVDANSGLFSWSAGTDGFARTLAWNEHSDARKRTERQFAAVLANLCVRQMKLTLADSTMPGLSAGSVVPGSQGQTVAGWAQATDAQLTALRASSLRNENVRSAYRQIYATAWMLDHGVGMGQTCRLAHHDGDSVSPIDVASDANASDGPTAEVAALADAMDAMLGIDGVMSAPAPNPSRDRTSIAFSVSDANGSDVHLAVYDLAGRQIRVLASGQFAIGVHDVTWDGRSDEGQSLRAGVYFVSGHVGATSVSRSVLRVE